MKLPSRPKLSRPKSTGRRLPRPANPFRKEGGSFSIFMGALRDFGAGWRRYAIIIAIVLVPINIIDLVSPLGSDTAGSAFANMATVVMCVILLWATVQQEKHGKVPGPLMAYYDGSAALIRFLVVFAVVMIGLLPVIFATVLYMYNAVAPESAAATLTETIILDSVLLLISMISVWAIVRFGLAMVIVVAEKMRPVEALLYARRLSLGRFWRTLGQLAAFVIYAALLSIPLTLIAISLNYLQQSQLAVIFFVASTTFIILPLTNLYFLRLYRVMQAERDPVTGDTQNAVEIAGATAEA